MVHHFEVHYEVISKKYILNLVFTYSVVYCLNVSLDASINYLGWGRSLFI